MELHAMEEVNYKWVAESENQQLKLRVEEILKEVDKTIKFQEYKKKKEKI